VVSSSRVTADRDLWCARCTPGHATRHRRNVERPTTPRATYSHTSMQACRRYRCGTRSVAPICHTTIDHSSTHSLTIAHAHSPSSAHLSHAS
jgi:hypothetical protein